MKVFVYGTLKRGFHNHACMKGAEFLREDNLATAFRMFDTGGFPVILPATPTKPGYFPTGEVYQLPVDAKGDLTREGEIILARLDRLEAEGHMYDRKVTKDMTGDEVSVYVGCASAWNRFDNQDYLGDNIKVDAEGETVTYGRAA